MDGARDQFFACAGLAENAHARFAGGNALDLRNQFLHRRTGTDQFLFSQSVTQLAVFLFEARDALSHTVASCPAIRKARESEARVFGSSSTRSRWALRGKRRSFYGALIGSRGHCRRRGLGFWRRFARLYRLAGLALRQIDSKCGSAALAARDRNGAVMIADHRLHDREPKSRAL